ncbi:RNA polymerase sigma factor [Kallotenue papyrolyticum]|uniref:RNA polymerase sigma factor n=1 Tax=Kallotenue papyrolyticum TaxID=1325125 RepID=UPI000471BC01|nr:sigma-70 family RNA polymerase sigma factor [Kallotenue papyrolyticum]
MTRDSSSEYETSVADGQLALRARDGERQAFNELVRRYQDLIFRLGVRLLGSVEDAEDAAQDIFLRAYTRLSTFRGQSSFKTWLVRLAINTCLTQRARQRPLEALPGELIDGALSVEDQVLQAEAMARLHQALQALPPQQRVAVVLRDLEGLSYREIAEIVAVPEATARVWAFRGRERLKELLT